ncbi:MAG: Methyltransferase type 11 [Parcubacteria group bacterium Gr01-1014_18]|nr:MAG: Methyltransferase type 11 [Parcubacteria group bacterium Greene0416_36]TSC79527.1 MAG: Methyltransferase type 11 [Parcubacteria group bacterium Gr01-1014_18]TSC97985.1 MAG: Methyltransferase type 11 [Parcubacteria group bacterium Greene1014_20]TSD06141.1 MAG: Methyltransferase type 11 [Parcubacteria group bacterium Greene0714_2]
MDKAFFLNQANVGEKMYHPLEGPEKGLVHSYYDPSEIKKIFFYFKDVTIVRDEIGRWIIWGEK